MEIMRAMKEVSVEFRSQKHTIWDSPFDRARESWKCKNTGKGRDRNEESSSAVKQARKRDNVLRLPTAIALLLELS